MTVSLLFYPVSFLFGIIPGKQIVTHLMVIRFGQTTYERLVCDYLICAIHSLGELPLL